MIDLASFVSMIMELDWGCGCCSDTSQKDLEARVFDIIRKVYYASNN